MDGGNPSLNDLVQQAKSLGVWNDSLAAMLNEAQSSHLATVLLQLNTAKMENLSLTTKVTTLATENTVLKTENTKVNTELTKVNTELTKVNTELTKVSTENTVLKTELETRSLEILRLDKNPLVNLTASSPHAAKLLHEPAVIERVKYDFKTGINVPYDAPYTDTARSVDSEQDCQSFVAGIVKAICSGISSDIHVVQNRRIAGTECDLLLLHSSNRIPFAAIEIKKNGDDLFVKAIFEDNASVPIKLKGKVQGENLDQLNAIALFGFTKVFGAISDGNHSMITCTHFFSEDDRPRSLETPPKESKKRSAQAMSGESQGTSPDNAIRVRSNPQYAQSHRTLYCSDYTTVNKHDGWDPTLHLFTHFVSLALATVESRQFNRDVPLNTNLPARIIKLSQGGKSHMFAHSTITFSPPLKLWHCLLKNNRVEKLYLFKSLGMGTNGDCCLATTESTLSFAAVKFFAVKESAKDLAEIESARWKTIYNKLPRTRVIIFPPKQRNSKEDACLVMPHLLPIDRDQRKKALKDGLIHDCLTHFASKGYHHKEVKWRHLGFFRTKPKDSTTAKVYLCDLGNLRRRDKESDSEWATDTEKWIEESIKCLKETAATEH